MIFRAAIFSFAHHINTHYLLMNSRIVLLSLAIYSSAFISYSLGQTPATYPYYVAATSAYNFPGTTWSESPGDIEQVIAEDANNYAIIASDGTRLQLPKPLAKRVTPEQAAAALILERANLQREMAEIAQLITAAAAQRQQQRPDNSIKEASDALDLLKKMQEMYGRREPSRRSR